MFEDGVYKMVGIVVVAGLFIILVCKLLGFQAKIVEGFSSPFGDKSKKDKHKDKDKDKDHSSGGSSMYSIGDPGAVADTINNTTKNILAQCHVSDRPTRAKAEKVIEALDDRIRAELVTVVTCAKTDSNGNYVNPLHNAHPQNLLDNPEAMALIQKLNELWKFHDTLEATINILDSTKST